MGDRRGVNQHTKELPSNCGEAKGKETAEVAAKKAGFDSTDQYRRVKKVLDTGVEALHEMMDAEEVTPSAAAAVATLPAAGQDLPAAG